jgi:hypothetical protein
LRFSPFINTVVAKVAKDQACYDKMRSFSHANFNDGWEIWLQCEAYNLLPDSRQYEYSRGNKYPSSEKKCDFLLRRDNMSLWLELKVLLKQDMNHLVDRFADDLNKIVGIDLPKDSNSVGAFAVIPLNASDLFSQETKERFIKKSNVDIKSIEFLAILPGAANQSGSYGSYHQINNDRIVILHYLRI